MTEEKDELLMGYDSPEIAVAAVSVQVIGELHRMLTLGWSHDEKSVKMVVVQWA